MDNAKAPVLISTKMNIDPKLVMSVFVNYPLYDCGYTHFSGSPFTGWCPVYLCFRLDLIYSFNTVNHANH